MGKFEKLLDKATSPQLLEPDWETILFVIDSIRSAELSAKAVMKYLKQKLFSDNPHVVLHTLHIIEVAVKNCGDVVVKEVATKEFMEAFKDLAAGGNDKVKEKVLELIQCWSHAFRDKAEYKIVKDTHQLMKLEGYEFEPWKESDALFAAESAPEWVEADNCYRCRAAFGVMTRKHHCRNCGQIFCDKCSNKTAPIPKFGIERDVRVCEICFDKLRNSPKAPAALVQTVTPSPKTEPNTPSKPSGGKTEEEIREEEELQLALAISQSEQEELERKKKNHVYNTYSLSTPSTQPSVGQSPLNSVPLSYKGIADTAGAVVNGSSGAVIGSETDSELAKYLNRSYWEQKRTDQKTGILRQSPTPSAPVADNSGLKVESPVIANGTTEVDYSTKESELALQNGDMEDLRQFAVALQQHIETFVNRIRSNQARGRLILNDTAIQSQFMSLTSMHSQLLKHLQELDDKRGYYESLQDKLVQIRDAREAVTALRQEHEEQRQAELAELQRQRQIAMMQKLDYMRQKKHEMLEQQRLLAIQRMQEQEREIQYRKQQAQQMIMYGGPQMYGSMPGVNPPYQPVNTGYPQQYGMPTDGQPQSLPPQAMMGHSTPGHYPQHPQMSYPPQSLPAYSQVGVASQPPPPAYSNPMPEVHYQMAGQPVHPQSMGYPAAGVIPYSGPIGSYYVPHGGYHQSPAQAAMPPQHPYQPAPPQQQLGGYPPQQIGGQQAQYQNPPGPYHQQPQSMPNTPTPGDYQQQPNTPRPPEAQLISFD